MSLGWLLRGVHHWSASVMIVLMAVHFLQVIIDGAYKAPREINFWVGLVLLNIVLGLSLTGYLLPWDQKGYWATKVATEIAGSVGDQVPALAVGGSDYGHHTLTRFFALHAGVLPGLLVVFLVIHIAVFRRHSITAHINPKKPRPDQDFWPDQVLKDAVACLAVLLVIMGLAWYVRAELGAPADAAENYSAARPEWYFLFLFQFLKYFPGEHGKLIGAVIIPGLVMLLVFLMPFIGRTRFGHLFNVVFVVALLLGATTLGCLAWHEDNYARLTDTAQFADLETALDGIAIDLRKNGEASKYQGKTNDEQIKLYAADNQIDYGRLAAQQANYHKFQNSQDFLSAVAAAETDAQRARDLAGQGIPPTGALTLLREDPKTQGPKLFQRYCAGCHDHVDKNGDGITMVRPLRYETVKGKQRPVPTGAPNLYRFASRAWLDGLLDPEQIAKLHVDTERAEIRDAPYFGNTKHRRGDMAETVADTFTDLDQDGRALREELIGWLSAEAQLPYQKAEDEQLRAGSGKGRDELFEDFGCFECHKLHDLGDLGTAPDLTGYGSRQWMIDLVRDPDHERFYGSSGNDRMPSFDPPGHPNKQQLTPGKIGLIVDWLREDWYEPAPQEMTNE